MEFFFFFFINTKVDNNWASSLNFAKGSINQSKVCNSRKISLFLFKFRLKENFNLGHGHKLLHHSFLNKKSVLQMLAASIRHANAAPPLSAKIEIWW